MSLFPPTGHLKTSSGLEPVPRCEPNTYQPISYDIATAPPGPVGGPLSYVQHYIAINNMLSMLYNYNALVSCP